MDEPIIAGPDPALASNYRALINLITGQGLPYILTVIMDWQEGQKFLTAAGITLENEDGSLMPLVERIKRYAESNSE